jgi:hypothetical protein
MGLRADGISQVGFPNGPWQGTIGSDMPPDYIDLYCERIAPGLLGEPLNTLGNLGFFAAALWLALRLRREGRAQFDEWLLVVLVALVGAGSTVFHMVATRPMAILDQAFIGVFVLVFVHRWLARTVGLGGGLAGLGVLAFGSTIGGVRVLAPTDLLNGSMIYLPVLVALAGMALWARRARHPSAPYSVALFIIFAIALTFRTIDQAVCDAFPSGTHWAWHLLNAVVLAIACRSLRPMRR